MRNQKKYFFAIIAFLFFFAIVNVDAYSNNNWKDTNNSKLSFNPSINSWEAVSTYNENYYVKKKYQNECGVLLLSVVDYYDTLSSSEKNQIQQSDVNDTLINYNFAKQFVNQFKSSMSVDNWQIQKYSLNFVKMVGKINYNGSNRNYVYLATLNNGYLALIQYYGDNSSDCLKHVYSAAWTLKSDASNLQEDKISNVTDNTTDEEGSSLFGSLIITAICYMFSPLCIFFTFEKIDVTNAHKYSLWNSIIIGFIFLIISTNSGFTWNVAPAILYYFINKKLLETKSKKKRK